MDPTVVAAWAGIVIGVLAWVSERLSESRWRAKVDQQRQMVQAAETREREAEDRADTAEERAETAEQALAAEKLRADGLAEQVRRAAEVLTVYLNRKE